jgi:hypothetical protein
MNDKCGYDPVEDVSRDGKRFIIKQSLNRPVRSTLATAGAGASVLAINVTCHIRVAARLGFYPG